MTLEDIYYLREGDLLPEQVSNLSNGHPSKEFLHELDESHALFFGKEEAMMVSNLLRGILKLRATNPNLLASLSLEDSRRFHESKNG